ncbi:hypothetical protein DPX16_6723 [Anabarilius grahami]|uniref:Uncharacterized protein n=1 Tax=Anabarilius grahami TaxID=495550 RepID=A0A3N0YG18_ANAGA|nr:hypothetical protein DPX16_6723 [Anabarilius grahami]
MGTSTGVHTPVSSNHCVPSQSVCDPPRSSEGLGSMTPAERRSKADTTGRISSRAESLHRRTDQNRWKSATKMGLFIVSEIPASPMPPKPVTASDRLVGFRQDGRSLERYVEEFVELAYLVNWPDACLNACFLAGLDEDIIRFKEPACYFSLVDAINLILFLNCSEFVIEEVLDRSYDPRPVTPETQAAWPVHQSLFSSAYPSSEHSPGVLPDPKPRMANEKSSAGPRRPKRKRKKAAKQPQSPEFSASVQSQSPEFFTRRSQSPRPNSMLRRALSMLHPALAEPSPSFTEPAPALTEPAPSFNEPAPSFNEPAPSFNEPAPSFNEPAPCFAEHSPCFCVGFRVDVSLNPPRVKTNKLNLR